MWRNSIKLDILTVSNQFIHGHCLDLLNCHSFFITFVYASPNPLKRHQVWEQLKALEPDLNQPWVLGGDFNAICNISERFGGCNNCIGICSRFCDFLFQSGLLDMGFKGPQAFRRQKLGSDHRLILLVSDPSKRNKVDHPFHYIDAWNDHPSFHALIADPWRKESMGVNINNIQRNCLRWNNDTFGLIGHRKSRLFARIKGIEKALEDKISSFLEDLEIELKNDLNLVLDQEESFWHQKSRSH
ncbi:uncharacterized protein LOC120139203 [Hibiscus syriacus]|uniref:uncharacterized protein LOC120139203 n=1 Tax=Hibiscus syriacus TaxID=106335 RepID=UPI0019237322|nr:uncharacterized protein LOC120139203 [Hibiscus syriacus]